MYVSLLGTLGNPPVVFSSNYTLLQRTFHSHPKVFFQYYPQGKLIPQEAPFSASNCSFLFQKGSHYRIGEMQSKFLIQENIPVTQGMRQHLKDLKSFHHGVIK